MDYEVVRDSPWQRMAKVELYLESVKARIRPASYEALLRAVHEMAPRFAAGQFGLIHAGTGFGPQVQREFLAVMAIMTTGRMDHHVIDMPGPGSTTAYAVVTPEAANDPMALAGLLSQMRRWACEQQAVQQELDGIARASTDTGD
ncbi:hypothetical protein [Streptomyces zhihengii]|uniref:hypothetical protein n=1 Tax=Streptomyces zhihengii TaxID=1818004 RepID=UPI0033B492EE